eukprot:1519900-Alexandrium_andersonii.AAC.1
MPEDGADDVDEEKRCLGRVPGRPLGAERERESAQRWRTEREQCSPPGRPQGRSGPLRARYILLPARRPLPRGAC